MTTPATVAPINLSIDVPVSPAVAWAAITDPAEIVEWFTDAWDLGEVGSEYRIDFGEGSIVIGEVTELVPGQRFAHTWWWEGDEPEDVTRVAWSVEPHEGGATIRLVHDGWADGEAEARDDHEGYWTGYLDDLRDYLGEA
jgi:uncharacterized protein YndB with AHSA1/START domain